MPRFMIRIDDVGQSVDQSKPDVGLEGFRRWWDEAGWEGLPVYLGVVPAVMMPRDLCYLDNKPGVVLCCHGWDHHEGALSQSDLVMGHLWSMCDGGLIPPYNRYDASTIKAWRVITADDYLPPYIFGGFDGEHHNYGEAPRIVDGVLHLSAAKPLYAKSYKVAQAIKEFHLPCDAFDEFPVVITLHWRWDAGNKDDLETCGPMAGARRLRNLVADKLCTVEEAWEWARLNSRSSTSPANG